jgi:hypothetical protein
MTAMSEVSLKMFTEQQLRELSRRRVRVILPTMLLAVAAMLLYFLGVGQVHDAIQLAIKDRFGNGAAEAADLGLILVALAIFLVPTCIAEGYAKRFQSYCPSCGQLLKRIEGVIATKCCPSCENQIVTGNRVRSHSGYKRFQDRRARTFLVVWFWAWPAMALSELVWWYFYPQQALECRIWVAPLIGTTASGWTWVRTFDHRYVPQLIASVTLLGVLGAISWSSW